MTDWSDQHVLITGATGFIGVRLTRKLVMAQAQVWAGVYPGEAPHRVAALPAESRRVFIDLRDADSIRESVNECDPLDTVFHLAAIGVTSPAVDSSSALLVNTGGTVHLLEALRRRRTRRIVLVGTCNEYGSRATVEGLDPLNAYAASKTAAWAFARAFWRGDDLPIATVRPFHVYGPGQPGQTLIPAAIRAALAGEDFAMTPGEQERDFVYVGDVVDGMLATGAATGIDGESLDLGTGIATPIRQVVDRIWSLTGATGRILAGALPYRPGEALHLAADADRTAALIGWRAHTELVDGLRETIHEFRRTASQ